jgi:hypothetical protein
LQAEAKGMDVLVLFLDCDREGENICFEVMENAQPNMNHGGKYIFRARFSGETRFQGISFTISSYFCPRYFESDEYPKFSEQV